jgi:hypothetical protein
LARITKTLTFDPAVLEWVEMQRLNKKYRNLSHAVDVALDALIEKEDPQFYSKLKKQREREAESSR